MARVRLNETQDLPESHRWIFERIERRGDVLNIFRALSHSPEAMRRFMKFGSYFLEEGTLEPKLRELAIMRAGWLCHAPYEFSQHVAFARAAGLSDDQIRAIPEPHARAFSPKELTVLAFATEMTSDATVSDATFEAAREYFSEEELVELALVTGYYNLVSRVLNTLQVDIDAPAARHLQEVGVEI